MDEREAARACPAFASLSPVELQDVLGMAARLELRGGATIFEQGSEADGMFVVVAGHVRIVQQQDDGGWDELAKLGPGAAFGEMALLLEYKRSASVIAAGDCVVLRLDTAGFLELLESQDRVACRILLDLARMLSRRLIALERKG